MPDAFQKKSDFEEEEIFTDSPQIPSITDDIVYCPKCGSINSFKKSKSGRLLNHFCSRCSLRMNDFWDAYLEGHTRLRKCKKCGQSTFEESIFCVVCGEKQEEIFSKRAEEISSARGDLEPIDPFTGEVSEPLEVLGSCFGSSGSSCLGVFLQTQLKKLPRKIRILLYVIFSVVMLAVIIVIILIVLDLSRVL